MGQPDCQVREPEQGPSRSRLRQGDRRHRERPGRRHPPGQRLHALRRRYHAGRHRRLREAWRRRERPHLGCREVYPVQQLRLRLPARRHPSVPPDRRRGRQGSRERQARPGQGQPQGLQVHPRHLRGRLHRLRQLRRCVPRQGQGPHDGSVHQRQGRPGCVRLPEQVRGLQGVCEQVRQHEEQPVRPAAVRVLRRLRRLRRDSEHQGHHPAVRRPHDDRQRDGLLLHLRRFLPGQPVLHQRRGSRSGLGQLPVRGLLRVRSGHEARFRPRP